MKKLMILFTFILLIPLVVADIIVPYIPTFYVHRWMWIIPIILLETVIAYFILKKIKGINFWHLLLIFLIANIVSVIVGFFLSWIPLFGTIIMMGKGISLGKNFIWIFPLFYLITCIIEFPFLYFYIRNKTKKSLSKSIWIILLVNAIGYLIFLAYIFYLVSIPVQYGPIGVGYNPVIEQLREILNQPEMPLIATITNEVNIKTGTGNFYFHFGAKTSNGRMIKNVSDMQYILSFKGDVGACTNIIKDIFVTPFDTWNNFDIYDEDKAFATLTLNVPKGTGICEQKVYIEVKDNLSGQVIGDKWFNIKIFKGGFF